MKHRKRMARFFVSIAFFALLAMSVPSQALAQSGTWETLTPMPTPRYGVNVGAIEGKLYVASGISDNIGGHGLYSTMLEVYDPATGAWTTEAPIPQPIDTAATGVINGKLYLAGGRGPPSGNIATLQVYDPASNTWTTMAPMPFASAYGAGAVIDGKLYVAGGTDPSNNYMVTTVRVYDPATNSWAIKAPMPTARARTGAAVINGILYVVGGGYNFAPFVFGGCLATVEAYDPATDTWTTKAPMPSARMGMATAVINGILYAAGGATANSISAFIATLEAYNPATDTWTVQAPMPTPKFSLAADVIGGKLYTAGGYSQAGVPLNVLEVFTPTTPLESVQQVETAVVSIGLGVLKNANMQNTLINKLNAVIANIEAGNYADALGQLQNDILAKTDGCAKSGMPDKNDWITNCAAQGVVYPLIMEAIKLSY